jgi:2,4-dienoyl-CoA reductase (NADPH2)
MMERPINGLIKKVRNSPVELRIPRRATVDVIAAEKPDVVLLAVGATPIVPAIPGLGQVFFAEDILTGKVIPENRVLVIGGGLAGIEVAEFLASKKHTVTIVEMLEDIARDMEPITRRLTLKMLHAMDVKIFTNTTISWFDEKKAYVIDKGGELLLGEFDTVVAAVGMRTLDDMDQVLRDRGFEVIVIGDAKKPRQIYDAVKDGYEAALGI